ncbi:MULTISPECIES: S49 family peptidase [unclassified Aureimonas]|uniref:S49 family peptidase n=1 Tax=unclassified Aureimonas TaxID=2615206 RepID=UPI0006FCF12B|nr:MULTISPECIES: S49 family peptidase [unclassified Aureimonas]KQT65145.1 peptidase S49 [Aureimonas sp. Leaf427]KQT76328.1 peptidase S49 [Aureimonas sp. Leaf460]
MAFSLKTLLPKRFRKTTVTVPVVRLSGTIMAASGPLRPSLSLAGVAGLLEKAFDMKDAPAVAISVNSPGGSPVQSRLIFKRIRDLSEEKKKPVLVFVEDVAASGGYMIACAGDEIIADPSSIVGSIGVVSGGFGFVEALQKLGIERRVHTSGRNKAVLDPFRPEREEDVAHLLSLQREIHETFIDLVKSRRGGKLAESEELFTGQFWSGLRGLELGLVDRLGDLRSVLRERFGDKVKPVVIQPSRGFLGRRLVGQSVLDGAGGFRADLAGAGAAERLAAIAEERLAWSRFGL